MDTSHPMKERDAIDWLLDRLGKSGNYILNHVLSLYRRVLATLPDNKITLDFLEFHTYLLFPEKVDSKSGHSLEPSIAFDSKSRTVKFRLKSKSVSLSLTVSSRFKGPGPSMPLAARLLVCQLAFGLAFREPLLVHGPTCFKAWSVRTVAQLLGIQPDCFFLSEGSTETDLFGGSEPHTLPSFEQYATTIVDSIYKYIRLEREEANVWKTLLPLKKNSAARRHYDIIGYLRQELEKLGRRHQILPHCERAVALNARFGGLLWLRNLDQADQAMLEILSPICEFTPSFSWHDYETTGKPPDKTVSEDLSIVATVHTPSSEISPSLLSRFTQIRVEAPKLAEYEPVLQSLGAPMEDVQVMLSHAAKFEQATSRHLFQWLALLLHAKYPVHFGAQLLFYDQHVELKPPAQITTCMDQVKQTFEGEIKKKANNAGDDNMVLSRTTVENLLRLQAAQHAQLPLLLMGPPGIGKTQVVKFAAQLMGRKFVRISCSTSMTVEDLVGSYIPSRDKHGKLAFVLSPGVLATALQCKESEAPVILLDELNLSTMDVLSFLTGLVACPPGESFSFRSSWLVKPKNLLLV
eukprot:g36972.t1